MAKQQGAVAQPEGQAPQAVPSEVPASSVVESIAPAPAPQPIGGDAEFSSLMGTFRIFVILSILFDILFIFTILSFVKKSELKVRSPYVSPQLQSEFNTWSKVLVIGLVARVLLFVCVICINLIGLAAFIPLGFSSSWSTY